MKISLLLIPFVSSTNWHLESTLKKVSSSQTYDIFTNFVQGEVIGTWPENPISCMLFSKTPVNFKFTYLYDSFPLQVTKDTIFFWTRGPFFSVKIDTENILKLENLGIYCGDLSDVLGKNTIEGEEAERVRISSFPSDSRDLMTEGKFVISDGYEIRQNDIIRLTFPYHTKPERVFSSETVQIRSSRNMRVWEFRNFEGLKEVRFSVLYAQDHIIPSYEMIAEIVNDDDLIRFTPRFMITTPSDL